MHPVIGKDTVEYDDLFLLADFKKMGAKKNLNCWRTPIGKLLFHSNYFNSGNLLHAPLEFLVLMELGIKKDDVVAELVSQ